jgi:hypothetical protein
VPENLRGDELDGTPKLDTSIPHSARIWNYWLGGKDNYPVDQAAGDEYVATFPGIVDIARPEAGAPAPPAEVEPLGGIGRKP